MSKCPVCGTTGTTQETAAGYVDADAADCPRCGRFLISGTAKVVLEGLIQRRAINTSRLSHALRQRYETQRNPTKLLRDSDLKPYQEDGSHIPPQQQIDNFILWVGRNQGAPQEWAKSNLHALAARIGADIGPDESESGLAWLVSAFATDRLYDFRRGAPVEEYRLTPAGWLRYDALNRRTVNSRTAFMAMKFGDATLNGMLKDCFQPAAARAGFTLKPLNEEPAAGLIDNQIRAAIRTARFVVADLTHNNDGAYFEAGFAEGLGLPVIYTCEAGKFDKDKTHFDTNHMVTVLWDTNRLADAGRALTATIRNTLPIESKLDD